MPDLASLSKREFKRFVCDKISSFSSIDHSFASLFRMMFSESDSIFYERTANYRIERTSYKEAENLARKRAGQIRKTFPSFPHGSVIALYMENGVEWIALFWGIILSGNNPLLLNRRLDDDVLEKALALAGARAVITDSNIFSVDSYHVSDLDPDVADLPSETGSEFLIMSSGTSGRVKLCAYTAEELYWQISDSKKIILKNRDIWRRYNNRVKVLDFLPFYHIFGFVAQYIWFTFFGSTLVHLDNLSPSTILHTIRLHEVTHVFAVPLLWNKTYSEAIKAVKARGEKVWKAFNALLRLSNIIGDIPIIGNLFRKAAFREVRDHMFGDSISFMITGGGSIRPEVIGFFNAIGYTLVNGYGMSEIGIASVELSNRQRMRNLGSIGRPFSSLSYDIAEDGELVVSGKSMARCVIEDGCVSEPNKGSFHTGDIVHAVRGRYYLEGRKDNLFVSESGENISPERIEGLLSFNDARDVCLIGCPDGGLLLIISVLRGLPDDRVEELERGIKKRLIELKISSEIRSIFFTCTPLIKGNEFKVNRRRIAEEYYCGSLEKACGFSKTPGQSSSPLMDRIRNAFSSSLGKDSSAIGDDDDFFLDLGGSSLDYLALVTELESHMFFILPEEGKSRLRTVSDFCRAMENGGIHG